MKRTRRLVPVDQLPRDTGSDDHRLESVAARLDVSRELELLTPEERELLELRYGEDLTQSAIAARTEMPEGTVKVRLHRLRRGLSESLREHGPGS